ncbi:MAG: MFS transporter [Planctomycetaceae bacterium]
MRPYLVFSSAGLSLLMWSIDATVVAVALPQLVKELDTNVLTAAWTMSIYLIAITSFMPLMGNLSDTFGRKNIFLLSLIVFTGGSLACGLVSNIYSLIAFRFLQGIGGASFLPTASGIVSDQFPENREKAIGLFTSIFPIGGIIGPNLGGWIVSQYSWRYIFYINLPIGIIVIAMVLILLRGSRASARPPIDFWGAFLFLGTIFLLMLGLNRIAEPSSGFSLLFAALFFAGSAFFLYLFWQQEKRVINPIMDLVLLQSKPFLAANVYNLMIGAGVIGIFSFIPLYATSVYHLSTLVSGIILTPRSVAVIPASAITSFLLRRWGYRMPMIWGVIIISFSTILLGEHGMELMQRAGIYFGTAWTLSMLIMISGAGMGIALPASNNAVIELMPEKVSTITGLRGTFRSVGAAIGISVVTMILHLSPSPAVGFRIIFISFGLILLLTIPFVFLLPTGKGVGRY